MTGHCAGFPRTPPVDWKTVYPAASDPALDLLKKLLEFNPKKRLTPTQVALVCIFL